MKFDAQQIKPWITQRLSEGYTYDSLIWALVTTQGYALHIAQRIMAACVYHDGNNGELFSVAPDQDLKYPDPITKQVGQYDIDGRDVTVSFVNLYPNITMFDEFLTEAECSALIEIAKEEITRSKVAAENPEDRINPGRTSESYAGVTVKSTVIDQVRARIAKLVQWPVSHIELPEIIRYQPDQKFDPHRDYFNKNSIRDGAFNAVDKYGNRVATFLLYLQQPKLGGSTYFANSGFEFFPKTRSALFFSYPECEPFTMSLHAGTPVIEGEKWVMTFFMRERAMFPDA